MWLTAALVAVIWAGQVMTVPNDLTIALRHHRRQPAFALTVVCTLAFTVGATSAVFSIVNTVLVRELPFAAPDRLVYVASVRSDNPAAPFTLRSSWTIEAERARWQVWRHTRTGVPALPVMASPSVSPVYACPPTSSTCSVSGQRRGAC
jgi:hypothetical protein